MRSNQSIFAWLMIALISIGAVEEALAADRPLGGSVKAAAKIPAQNTATPVTRNYRQEVLGEMQRLVSISQNASRKLRGSIVRLKEKGVETGPYSHLAKKYDEMAAFAKRKRLAVQNDSRAYTIKDVRLIKSVSEGLLSDMTNMGNFDVQELMTRAGKEAAIAAKVEDSLDEAEKSIVGNLGGGSDDSDDPDP